MKQGKKRSQLAVFALAGIIPVVWIGLKSAPFLAGGVPAVLKNAAAILSAPFQITLCKDSLRAVLVLLFAYGLALGIILSNEHNYRLREEHGSAKWGSPKLLQKKYAEADISRNIPLTRNVSIGLDGRKHRRNLNILVCGGSGNGKTRCHAKPAILNAGVSFVVPDPKSEIIRAEGNALLAKGYNIKVLDLINIEKSHSYNPFVYLRDENDIQRLATNLFKSTTPKGAKTQDPFWDQAAMMLLLSLMLYLLQ